MKRPLIAVYGTVWFGIVEKFMSDEMIEMKHTLKEVKTTPTFADYSASAFSGIIKGFVSGCIWPLTTIAYLTVKMRE